MAYANWLVPSKTQGSGNDTVNVTAGTDNTGRSPRSTNMTFKASGVGDVVRQVIQAGKPENSRDYSAALEYYREAEKLTANTADAGELLPLAGKLRDTGALR